MGTIVTVRIDETTKKRATAILRQQGHTPSSAIQGLFDYVIKHDALPFAAKEKPDKGKIISMVEAFDQCHTKVPIAMTDKEIRSARIEERYGSLS